MSFQLIDEEGRFITAAKQHFEKLALRSAGKNYFVLGIIGAQSSGKSTLLNAMFDTGFDTLDSSQYRRQTTKGIWIGKDPQSPLLVLDIEGSDSRERWEGKSQFERSTAMFGLVLSNLLIINVWTQDIGRFTASNLEIIKIIFEINLRYFNQESAKHLLFVIRDFKDNENLDYIKKIITEDVTRLWHEIKKPKQFEHAKPDEFFNLHFFPVHNFIYEKPRFDTDTQELAVRLRDQARPDFLFKHVEVQKNIPFDGLYMFAERCWETIKENKELNLPSQKIIVSNFRCGEVKKEALDMSAAEVDTLKASLAKGAAHARLREELEDVLSKSVKHFKEQTEQYDDQIVTETESQLRRDSYLQFAALSAMQKDRIETVCVKFLREKVAEHKSVQDFGALLAAMRGTKKEAITRFEADIHAGTTDEPADIAKLVERFSQKAESIVVEAINSRVNLLLKNLQNQKVKELDMKLTRIFTELKPTFWQDFLDLFHQTFDNYSSEILSLRNDAAELKTAVDDQLFDSMKLDLYLTVRNSLATRLRGLNALVLEKFRRKFENTESGMRRNWKTIDEAEITALFKTAKEESLAVLESASELVYPGLLTEPEKHMLAREEVAAAKMRLEDDMNAIVERVYNSKYNRSGLQQVPAWLWVVLAYFMHDNILEWIRNPFVLLLTIAIAGGVGYLVATGKWSIVVSTVQTLLIPVRMLLESKGILQKAKAAPEKPAAPTPN